MPALRTLGILLVAVMGLGLAGIHSTLPVHATSTPQLLIDPPNQSLATPGSTVTFNVNASNISPGQPLAGWEIYVRTNNSILSPVEIQVSSSLRPGFENVNCVNNVGTGCNTNDAVPGTVHSAFSLTGNPSVVSGNFTLFTITYNAVAGPYSLLTFLRPLADSLLIDQYTNSISFTPGVGKYGNVPTLPVANFAWTPLNPRQGDVVTFNASSSSDPNGHAIVSYSWDFAPFNSGSALRHAASKITKQVLDAGDWTATLTVTNDQGTSSISVTKPFYVATKPVRDLAVCTTNAFSNICLSQITALPYDLAVPGANITIKVNVFNLGTSTETNFTLTVTIEGTPTVFNRTSPEPLGPKAIKGFTFYWGTKGLAPDSYTIHAHLLPLLNEKGQFNETEPVPNNDAYYTIRLIYPQLNGLLSLDLGQFGGLSVLLLLAIGVIFSLTRRRRNRRLSAQRLQLED